MTEMPVYLDGDGLLALLTPAEALSAIQAFFASHGPEQVVVPSRIHLPVPGRNTTGLYMPAATETFIGVKIVHLMPERFPSVEAEVFLYDAESGRLLFWGDGKPMTALRTAAVSAAASLRLMPQCKTLMVYGAGVQAAAHVSAFLSAYPGLEEVWAVTRSEESWRRLRGSLEAALPGNLPLDRVRRADQPKAVLGAADCIVTTTPAAEPLFAWEDLAPEAHVVGVGSATHDMNELPPEAFLEGRVWLDTEGALEEAGDCRAALARGWSTERLEGNLFDLLGNAGGNLPREAGRRTVFKSVGHAAQDLAVLMRLWERIRPGNPTG